jgi:hypothetical protein
MINDYITRKMLAIKESREYDPEENDIVLSFVSKIVYTEKSTIEEDMKKGIDSHIRLMYDAYASRKIKTPSMWNRYHSIMLRYSSKDSTYVEYQKILDGTFAKICLYRWLDENNKTNAWMVIDMDKLRLTNEILECSLKIRRFRDGGSFVTIKIEDIAKNGCIIDCNDVVRDYLLSKLE